MTFPFPFLSLGGGLSAELLGASGGTNNSEVYEVSLPWTDTRPAPDRELWAMVIYQIGRDNRAPTAATLGGVAATIETLSLGGDWSTGTLYWAAFAHALVPTGIGGTAHFQWQSEGTFPAFVGAWSACCYRVAGRAVPGAASEGLVGIRNTASTSVTLAGVTVPARSLVLSGLLAATTAGAPSVTGHDLTVNGFGSRFAAAASSRPQAGATADIVWTAATAGLRAAAAVTLK